MTLEIVNAGVRFVVQFLTILLGDILLFEEMDSKKFPSFVELAN